VTLHDEGSDYEVGEGKVFIAFQALIYLEQNVVIGRIGEAASANGAIAKEVLKFSNGTNLPFMTDCIGVFAAGTFARLRLIAPMLLTRWCRVVSCTVSK